MKSDDKNFDSKEINYFLNLLQSAKNESSIESYIYIKNILNTVEFIIPCIFYPKGSKFVRTRIHKKDEIFFEKVEELSYRKDLQNIKNFGRSNEPGQSVFYCASDDWLSFLEVSPITRANENKTYEYHTTGLWISTEDLVVVSLLTNDDIRGQHEEIDNLSINFESLISAQADESAKVVEKMIQFLSKEFSRVAEGNSNHYKITTAFTNYIFDTVDKADGIMYPSSLYLKKGFNFAFKPEIIDQKMQFHAAFRRKMEFNGDKEYFETEFIESSVNTQKNNIINWPK